MRRRWLPGERRLRWRGRNRDGDGFDLSDAGGLGDDPISLVIGLVIGAVVLLLVVLGILPLLLLILEAILLAGLLVFAVVWRVVLRRPWVVEARSGEHVLTWRVPGWRRSGRVIEQAAMALARGEVEPHPADAA